MSVLEKASDLIDFLGKAGEPVTLAHVRSALGMPKSSAHRLLGELAALGIVRRTEGGLYSLGPRLLYWGEAAAETFDLRTLAESAMRRLRDEVGESVHLYIRDDDARICIAAVEGHHELRPFIQLGRRLPLHAGAAGKLLLAFAAPAVVQRVMQQAAADAQRYPDAPGERLASELDRIRADHYAASVGERESGVSAIATSVSDSRGRVVAAVSLSAPSARVGTDGFDSMRAPLRACAATVSGLLSGRD